MRKQGRGVPGEDSVIARKRTTASAITMAAAAGLLAIGISHEEMGEALFNACMLCLSCIGIG